MSIQKLFPYTLWLFNIAMENDTFIDVCFDDLPIYVYIYIPRCSVALEYLAGWWCNNHLEKYEFVKGVGMTSQKIKFMFETTPASIFLL